MGDSLVFNDGIVIIIHMLIDCKSESPPFIPIHVLIPVKATEVSQNFVLHSFHAVIIIF